MFLRVYACPCAITANFFVLCVLLCVELRPRVQDNMCFKICDRLERKANETDRLMHITTGKVCSDLNTNSWAVFWIKKTNVYQK